jgi:Icc-related predicted phosphoesterase
MTILFVTDIHGVTDYLRHLPAADLLLLGGDLTSFGSVTDVGHVLDGAGQCCGTVFGVLGNCDPAAAENVLQQRNMDLNLRQRHFGHLRLFGCSAANRTPFRTPYEWDDATRARQLQANAPGPGTGGDPLILVSHAPPRGSGAGRLLHGGDAGSDAVAEFAGALAPALILCGHIHESRGVFDWHGIPVVNPGPLRDGCYAVIEPTATGTLETWLETL